MKDKFVILKSRPSGTRDVLFGARGPMAESAAAMREVTVDVDEITRSQLATLNRDRGVLAVAPAMPMKLIAPVGVPGAPAQPAAQTVTWGVKAVGADASPFSGAGVVVAVLDTGIDASHAAFTGVELVQQDFTGEGNGDGNGHGTHCAGTVFGRAVNGTRIGVAPGVTRALIGKVLGQNGGGSSEQIIGAMLWAVDQGAHVISMSLGMDFPGYVAQMVGNGMPAELATSRALEAYRANTQLFDTLAAHIRSRGQFTQPTLIVAAAGNESQREVDPDFEIAVSPPAIAEGIVSVAALGETPQGFEVAKFSNTGANVSGPGVGVLSAKVGGGLRSLNGTSMATPHVAGVTALWAEKLLGGGRLGIVELTSRLIASCASTGLKPGFDPFDVGAGLVRAPSA